ncbi:hypothetical protein GGF37_002863, partial [Kickxella alabastrina]
MRICLFFSFIALSINVSVAAATEMTSPESTTDDTLALAAKAIARIAGGTAAGQTDFASIAFLEAIIPGVGGSSCTGSLIAPNVVLTAAHCTVYSTDTSYNASNYNVYFTHKTPDSSMADMGYSVAQVIPYPIFTMATLNHDIALLILEKEVPESVAKATKIYTGPINTGTPLRAAGFGMTNPTDIESIPAELMQVDLKVGSEEYCRKNLATYHESLLICTDGAPGVDTCMGDSGGPLSTPVDNGNATYVLLGITSYSPINDGNPNGYCAQKDGTGFYTRASAYLPWIVHTAGLTMEALSITNVTTVDDNNNRELGNLDS